LDRNFNYGDPQKSEARKKDLEHNFTQIVDFAIDKECDLFIIGGDIFDRANPANAARVYLVDQLKRLKDSSISTFLIGGNHDVPKIGNQTMAIQVIQSAGLATVFSDSESFQERLLTIHGNVVQVLGKSYNSINQGRNPFTNYPMKKKGIQICLIHASLIGMNVTPDNPFDSSYNPFGVNDIPQAVDYLALGHYHNYFERTIEKRMICNPGSIERLTWQDSDSDKGFIFAEVDDRNFKTTFIPLKSREHETFQFTVDKTVHNISELIVSQLSQYSNPEQMIRVNVTCNITNEQKRSLQISELMNNLQSQFFHIDLNFEFNLPNHKKYRLGKPDNPSSAFSTYMDGMIDQCASEQEKKHLHDAKQLGLNYLGQELDNN